MARAANAPDPVYSLVGCYTFGDEKRPPTPDELDRLVHTIIACGPRGLIYRLLRDALPPPLVESIRRANTKLLKLRPLLLIAEPMDWATSSNPQVEARVLLAGRRGLLLVAINRGDAQGRLAPTSATDLTVDLPPWIRSVNLAPESDRPDGAATVRDRRIHVRINRLATAALFAFHADMGR
jgi:hypothetical protein